jgi:hypothetical protein
VGSNPTPSASLDCSGGSRGICPAVRLPSGAIRIAVLYAVLFVACRDAGGDAGSDSPTDCSPRTTISLVAENSRFDRRCLAVPANQPFTVTMNNRDGRNHGFVIAESQDSANVFYEQPPLRGPRTATLSVGPLRPGDFVFKCQVHPEAMQGRFVVR